MSKGVSFGKMQKGWKKNVVYMVGHESGFTLVSALLRLLLISISLPMLSLLLASFPTLSIDQQLSIQQFYFILQMEAYEAEEVTHTKHTIQLHLDEFHTVSYERYGNYIRRRVNATGNEIYERNIQDFSVEAYPTGLLVKITDLSGEEHERVITTNKK